MEDWKVHIQMELRKRQLQQVAPFREMIGSYLEAVQREEALLDDLDGVREAHYRLEQEICKANIELEAYKTGGGVDGRQMAALQTRYDQLKEEQSLLFRTQHSHVQRLLDLGEQVKDREALIATLQSQLEQAKERQKELMTTIAAMREGVEEKNLGLRIMQDELTALQLELLTTDEKIGKLEEENRKLKAIAPNGPGLSEPPSVASGPTGCPKTSTLSFRVEGRKELVNNTILDPAQDRFALCTSSSSVALHSFSEGTTATRSHLLRGAPSTGITAGAFDSSGSLFVGCTTSTGTSNPSIFSWHVPTERLRGTLAGHDGLVTGVAFLRGDDTKIASGSHDHTLRLYDLPRGLCLRTVETKSAVTAVIAGSFGILSAHADGSICRWDERSGKMLAASSTPIHSRSILGILSLEDSELVTISLDHTVKTVDLRTLLPVRTMRHEAFRVPAEGGHPALSPDGKFIAAGSSDGSVFIWNRIWDGQLETVLQGHESAVVATAWSKQTGLLASADRSGGVKIWS